MGWLLWGFVSEVTFWLLRRNCGSAVAIAASFDEFPQGVPSTNGLALSHATLLQELQL